MNPQSNDSNIQAKTIEPALSSEARAGIFFSAILLLFFAVSWLTYVPPPNPAPSIVRNLATSSKEIVRGDASKKQVIFTFDGGDSSVSTESILATLAKHGVTGTFFLTGKFMEKYPAMVRRIAAAGHEIYSHTYSHPHLTEISDQEISRELIKTQGILESLTGKAPFPYFRAPYGDRDERVLDQAFKEGYQSVYWSVDALDWKETEGVSAESVKEIILANVAPGNIYLMHLGDAITGDILDEMFTTIESRGYRIVPLSQGL